jgi:hypothetical protein
MQLPHFYGLTNMKQPELFIDKKGTKRWKLNGKLHRLDGPAVEYVNGTKKWYVKGKPHRLDGPAIECADGQKEWCVDGKRHRLDGPAVEWPNGDKSWYVDGKEYQTQEEHSLAVFLFLSKFKKLSLKRKGVRHRKEITMP